MYDNLSKDRLLELLSKAELEHSIKSTEKAEKIIFSTNILKPLTNKLDSLRYQIYLLQFRIYEIDFDTEFNP